MSFDVDGDWPRRPVPPVTASEAEGCVQGCLFLFLGFVALLLLFILCFGVIG